MTAGHCWLPGPVEVHPDVARAMLHPTIGHRSPAGFELADRAQQLLRRLLGTSRPVILATASATAMMEAAVRGGVRERMLAIVSGNFGERFATIAERCDREVVRLKLPRGQGVTAELFEAMLDGPPVDAVSMVHVETSTGALSQVTEVLRLARERWNAVTLVDAVASVGGMPVDHVAWQADFVLGSTQKALALPPGLSFAMASDRFLDTARENDDRGLYLDPVNLHEAAAESRFAQTPALPLVHALVAQLERIETEGLSNRWERHRQMRQRIDSWVDDQAEVEMLAPAGHRADTVSTLVVPPEISASQLVARAAADGWLLGDGLGDDHDREIRIGHMGDATLEQLDQLLDYLEVSLGSR